MKNIFMKSAAAFILLCALFITQTYAGAEPSPLEAESHAKVEFSEGEGPTYPVDPDFPEDEDTDVEPTTGSLAIVRVSKFNFGSLPITTTSMSIEIEPERPNIQIVDLRGTAAGWKLTAKLSKFTGQYGESLPGAEIKINNGHPISLSTSDEPVPVAAVLSADGSPVPVIRAAAGAGTGLWVMRWYPVEDETTVPPMESPDPTEPASYISLEIPAGSASIGMHTAFIDWVLENTP